MQENEKKTNEAQGTTAETAVNGNRGKKVMKAVAIAFIAGYALVSMVKDGLLPLLAKGAIAALEGCVYLCLGWLSYQGVRLLIVKARAFYEEKALRHTLSQAHGDIAAYAKNHGCDAHRVKQLVTLYDEAYAGFVSAGDLESANDLSLPQLLRLLTARKNYNADKALEVVYGQPNEAFAKVLKNALAKAK